MDVAGQGCVCPPYGLESNKLLQLACALIIVVPEHLMIQLSSIGSRYRDIHSLGELLE